ncbi:MAG TPA: hypothetical protein VF783_17245 [Terriglobales bacterium]
MCAERRFRDDAIKAVYFWSATNDGAKSMVRFHLLAQQPVLGRHFQMCCNPVEHQPQLIEMEGLGDVVVRA